MKFADILVDNLIVNPSNDRHGPTPSEKDAINWLFQNKTKEMKSLAAKIADAGRIYDSPLVVREGNKFLVRDGNRRVTCLKLIHEPMDAPTEHQAFFATLKSQVSDKISSTVPCQIEEDAAVVEQILETRHNGVQGGIGQLPWGPREKANHANRVSGKSDYAWSQRIETFLTEEGFGERALLIKRSTLDRLLQAKKSRETMGLDVDSEGNLTSSQNKDKTLKLLLKLVADMEANKLTLNELLKAANRDSYIEVLGSQGYLPTTASTNGPKSPVSSQTKKSQGAGKKRSGPTKRTTLIPRGTNYKFSWIEGQNKIHLAWEQLQYHLDLEKHKFAVAVMLRTLIELTVQNYQNKNGIAPKNSLVKDLRYMNQKLLEGGQIDKSTHRDGLRVIEGGTASISIESLQRVLHSKSHLPAKDDLTTTWDCLEPLLVTALKSCQ